MLEIVANTTARTVVVGAADLLDDTQLCKLRGVFNSGAVSIKRNLLDELANTITPMLLKLWRFCGVCEMLSTK